MCQRGQGGRAGAWAGESLWLVGASRVQLGLRWPRGLTEVETGALLGLPEEKVFCQTSMTGWRGGERDKH